MKRALWSRTASANYKPQLCYSLLLWPGQSHLISLSFSLLICKAGRREMQMKTTRHQSSPVTAAKSLSIDCTSEDVGKTNPMSHKLYIYVYIHTYTQTRTCMHTQTRLQTMEGKLSLFKLKIHISFDPAILLLDTTVDGIRENLTDYDIHFNIIWESRRQKTGGTWLKKLWNLTMKNQAVVWKNVQIWKDLWERYSFEKTTRKSL